MSAFRTLFSLALSLTIGGPIWAQTTLSLSSVLPFDRDGVGPLRAEAGWQWQRDPWTLGASAALTLQGWNDAKLSLSYKISNMQASASADFTPQGLKSAGTQLKLELKDFSLENALSFETKGFKSGTVKFKVGPSMLNATGSAKLTPTGISEPAGTLNFSLSFDEGDFGGATTFNARGFKEQALSATGSIDDWTITMSSVLTLAGFKSQSFELGTRLWEGQLSLSLGVTIESQGITGETLSADLMLDYIFLQGSLDFTGLELSGVQLMANGSVGSVALDVLVMASLEGLQFAQATASGSLLGCSVSVSLDMSSLGLDKASLSIGRTLAAWTIALSADFGLEGLQNGSVKLSRTWKLP